MSLTALAFCANATLLLLHEIESAFEKEWELLRLPGGVTGFLVLHIPIIGLLLYGCFEAGKGSMAGAIVGVVAGVGGLVPVMVHEVLARRKDHFNRPLSRVIMYANAACGIALAALSIADLLE